MKKYKIHIIATLISIILFLVGNITLDLYEKSEMEQAKNNAVLEANKIGSSINQYINTSISVVYSLSYIIANDPELNSFNKLVQDLMDKYGVDYTIEVAPKGVIKYVYPENEKTKKIIGKDIFQYSNQLLNKEYTAKLSKDLYVSDLMPLFSGDKGLIVRAPVYTKINGEEKFWGCISSTISEKEIKNLIGESFENKYKYTLFSASPRNDKKLDIVSNINSYKKPSSTIETQITLPNNNWTLSIDETSVYSKNIMVTILRVITGILSICLYWGILYFINSSYKLKEKIEELKNAKIELNKSREKYKAFFDMSPDYIYIINLDEGKIEEANKKFNEEVDIEAFNNEHIQKFVEKYKKNYLKNQNNEKPIMLEKENIIINIFKNNEHKEIEVKSTLLENENINKILNVGRDLSEKRKIEKMERKQEERELELSKAREYDKIKTEFFANMSHELRTPLNVILGSIQLINLNLGKANSLEGIKETLERNNYIVRQNCYRLLRIISNIIDITKAEANYLHLEMKPYNIVFLVEEITLSVVEYAKTKGVSIEFDTEVEEIFINCDPDKIERIILNLLSNAIKFTHNGDKITVNIYDKKDNIEISVKDTGIGIPKENLENIFERFRQVNKSFIREHEGSGIGLSLVKSLVELHGGTILLKSELNEGSEFIIKLPKSNIDEISYEEYLKENIDDDKQNIVEKISIEFSDIYFRK